MDATGSLKQAIIEALKDRICCKRDACGNDGEELKDQTYTFELTDQGWGIAERKDYADDDDEIGRVEDYWHSTYADPEQFGVDFSDIMAETGCPGVEFGDYEQLCGKGKLQITAALAIKDKEATIEDIDIRDFEQCSETIGTIYAQYQELERDACLG